MLVVHPQTRNVLDTLFGKLKDVKAVSHPFWLLQGAMHTGKTSVLLEYVRDLLGEYAHQDFLYIKDYSEELGKTHSLKIEYKKNELTDLLAKDYHYADKGVREIKEWLSLSPVGEYKIVLIENIERMTTSAANALLKTIEEPSASTLILATTSNANALMETILSRALLLTMHVLDIQTIIDFLQQQFPQISAEDLSVIATLSQGRIGFALTMANNLSSEDQTLTLLTFWKNYKQIVSDQNRVLLHQLFVRVLKAGLLDSFLTLMHYDENISSSYARTHALIQTKKYLASNVSTEAVLLELVMAMI